MVRWAATRHGIRSPAPVVPGIERAEDWEAHLSRLFHKALHELEALQTRRLGGSAPLARLDVDGLPEDQIS